MALGAEKLASEATLNGSAAGEIRIGQIDILKLSAGSTFALFVVFTTPTAPSRADLGKQHNGNDNSSKTDFCGIGNAPAPFSLPLCLADRRRHSLQPCKSGIRRSVGTENGRRTWPQLA